MANLLPNNMRDKSRKRDDKDDDHKRKVIMHAPEPQRMSHNSQPAPQRAAGIQFGDDSSSEEKPLPKPQKPSVVAPTPLPALPSPPPPPKAPHRVSPPLPTLTPPKVPHRIPPPPPRPMVVKKKESVVIPPVKKKLKKLSSRPKPKSTKPTRTESKPTDLHVLRESKDVLDEKREPFHLFSFWKKPKVEDEKSSELNLIAPDVNTVTTETFWQNVSHLFRTVSLLVIVFALAFSLVKMYQIRLIQETSDIETQIQVVEAEVNTYKADQSNFIKLQQRAESLQTVLDEHIYWTAFLTDLEALTLPDVWYQSLVSDSVAGVKMEAISDSYETLAKQLRIFEEATETIVSAEILAGQLNQNEESGDFVSFSVALTLHDSVLRTHGQEKK